MYKLNLNNSEMQRKIYRDIWSIATDIIIIIIIMSFNALKLLWKIEDFKLCEKNILKLKNFTMTQMLIEMWRVLIEF